MSHAGPVSSPAPLLGGTSVVTFANDWTADPTSKHHVMRRVSNTNDVLWVESPGMRAPQLSSAYDRARLLTKAKAMFRRSRRALDRLHVMTPPTVPYPHSRLARFANAQLYRFAITRELRRLGFDSAPLLCVFVPQCAPYIRHLRRRFSIYYCVDKWTAFEGFDARTMERGEEELCRTSDLVLASAEDLADRCARYGSNVHYVPHGVDFAHFAAALDSGPLPADLAAIPAPRVGFFGLIHEWVDTELIGRLADILPYSFVLLGAAKGDLSALTARKNVFHLGRKPYASLPDYCRGFHAAILPFRMNELTVSVNPIKLREYAAAGLPVLSAPLPEVRKLPGIATCVDSLDDWVSGLRVAVEQGGRADERRAQSERVRGDDWAYVYARIASLVNGSPRATGMPAHSVPGLASAG